MNVQSLQAKAMFLDAAHAEAHLRAFRAGDHNLRRAVERVWRRVTELRQKLDDSKFCA